MTNEEMRALLAEWKRLGEEIAAMNKSNVLQNGFNRIPIEQANAINRRIDVGNRILEALARRLPAERVPNARPATTKEHRA